MFRRSLSTLWAATLFACTGSVTPTPTGSTGHTGTEPPTCEHACPEVAPPHFVPHLRSTLKRIKDDPYPAVTLFHNNMPRSVCYIFSIYISLVRHQTSQLIFHLLI